MVKKMGQEPEVRGRILMIEKHLILADDLTGAMDAGVQLTKRGSTVTVIFDDANLEGLEVDSEIFIVDTETRNVSLDESYEKIKKTLENTKGCSFKLIYKKIDSTLRGSIGREIDSILDNSNIDVVFVAPALPKGGRTTLKGIHYVNGIEVSKSEFGTDLFAPVKESCISSLIGSQSKRKVAQVYLDIIDAGVSAVCDRVISLIKQGAEIIAFDATSDFHLQTIAIAAMKSSIEIDENLLCCGSAGLMQFINYRNIHEKKKDENKDAVDREGSTNPKTRTAKDMGLNEKKKPNLPAIAVSGSLSKITKEQIQYAVKTSNIKLVKVNINSILTGDVQDIKERAIKSLWNNKNVILDAAGDDREDLSEKRKNAPEDMAKENRLIKKYLYEIVNEILSKQPISGLIFVGGDTAVSLCMGLGVTGIRILGEVEPYIPKGKLIGGKYSGLPVITKAGGFGNPSTLMNLMLSHMNY